MCIILRLDDRERLVGYLRKWRKPQMLTGCALYTDALKPVSILSLSLQMDGADIVMSIENTLKALMALKNRIRVANYPAGQE